jgi:hypothetical protein
MNTRRILVLILIGALTLSACAARATPLASREGAPQSGYGGGAAPEAMPTMAAALDASGVQQPGAPAAPADVNRLVIRNANLTMVVSSPAEAADKIAALANSLNGFVVSSNVYQSSTTDTSGKSVMNASITVRIPAEQLDAALAQIRAMAVEVRNENITGQDVTAQYTDLESQLRNLEAAEAQLQKIMDEATKTEDVLAVFNQLTYIRQQIEQIKGQMKYYSESAALSAVSIELLPDIASQPIEVGGWKPQGVLKQAFEALVRTLQGLTNIAIWVLVLVVPVLVVILLPIYIVVRVAVRRLRRPRPGPTPAAPAA